MALFGRSEYDIGRGDPAEGQFEVTIFAAFALVCAVGLAGFHLYTGRVELTLALAISMLVFGITVVRVEAGIYILIAAMLLSPEVQAGNVGDNAERAVNLRYDDFLIVVIFLGVMTKLAYEGRMGLWRSNPVNKGILAYFGVCVISTLLALRINVPAWDASVAFFVMLKMFEFYMVFWVVGLVATSMPEIQRQLKVFFVVSLIVCAYAIWTIGGPERLSAPFETGGTEPNTLGGYLLVVITLAVGLAVYAPKGKPRRLLIGAAIIAMIPLLATLSRASYTATFVALLLLGVMSRKPAILALLLVAVLSAPWTMPDTVVERVANTFHPSGVPIEVGGESTGIVVDTSTYERVYVWKKVAYNMKIWPWFGGGVSWETVLDSQYARVLIETGVFGFAAYVFLLGLMLRTNWQTWRWSRHWMGRGLGLGLFCITFGLMVHSLGTISFLIVRIMSPFWFLMGLSICAREIALLDHRQRVQEARAAVPAAQSPGREPEFSGAA